MFIINKKEFAIFASALRTYYPKENILPNEQAMVLWYEQVQDIPYKAAEIALQRWVATNKWSPSIADLREQVATLAQGESKSWGEAWGEVLRAVARYGSYCEAEALASLDELTSKVVKRLGYKSICMSENIANERASFRMIYEQEQQRQIQDAQIPKKLKELIATMPIMLLEEGGK